MAICNVSRLKYYMHLVVQMAAADMRKRYASSYLGLFWTIGYPLLSSAAYILIFGVFMSNGLPGRRYSGASFLPFYMLGFAPWTILSDVVSRSATLIRDNANLVTKVKFPHVILPLQVLVSSLIPFAVTLAIGLAALLLKGGIHWTGQFQYQLLGFVCVCLLSTGVSWLVAAFAVYVPDLGQLTSIVLTFWFFATPILYPADLFEGKTGIMRFLVMEANPFSTAIDLIRAPLFGIPLHVSNDIYFLIAMSLFLFVAGAFTYLRLAKGFADVL